MPLKKEFENWMSKKTNLSDSTIKHYSGAISNVSREMINEGIIDKSLWEMVLFELDSALLLILNNSKFTNMDSVGNRMYSSSLKRFRYFASSTYDSTIAEDVIVEQLNSDKTIQETERIALIKARKGQGLFRKKLFDKYNGKCVVTGIDNEKLLIASHIRPWIICDNYERINSENGLLLCPNYDRLFDAGLITFTATGKIVISPILGSENENRIGLNKYKNAHINLKTSENQLQNLEYHRDIIFVR